MERFTRIDELIAELLREWREARLPLMQAEHTILDAREAKAEPAGDEPWDREAINRARDNIRRAVERAENAEAALWRIMPNVYTIEMEGGQKPDRFEGPGETYHDAYVRERDQNKRLVEALERVANRSTAAGMHEQDRAARLQEIALAALTQTEEN